MNRLEGRMILVGAGLMTAFWGFAFFATMAFHDLNTAVGHVNQSAEILRNAQLVFRSEGASSAKEYLASHKDDLMPSFRATAVDRLLKNPNRSHLALVVDSETRFQKFNLELIQHQKKRVWLHLGFCGFFVTGLALLYLFVNRIWIFAPLEKLNQRMRDFLENKYSYEFAAPPPHEIGHLETTFNLMAQRVLSQIEALQSLDQAKSDFLSMASHELRTPLTSIKGSLALMKGGVTGPVSETSSNLMGIALGETDRLIRLINDLLDLAKIEAGSFPLSLSWTDVGDLLDQCAQSLQGFAQGAGVKLEVQYDQDIEAHIDRDRTQQIITNLASNAIKYSPPKGVVTLSVFPDESHNLRFEIKDQGKGIAPQDQEYLFQKFRQVTGPENPLVKGTGLGLAISKALVEEHGGSIHVSSAPDQGSTFYFLIPKWRLKTSKSEVSAS